MGHSCFRQRKIGAISTNGFAVVSGIRPKSCQRDLTKFDGSRLVLVGLEFETWRQTSSDHRRCSAGYLNYSSGEMCTNCLGTRLSAIADWVTSAIEV